MQTTVSIEGSLMIDRTIWGKRLPGLGVVAAIAGVATLLATLIGVGAPAVPISPMLLAIATGLVLAGLSARRPAWTPGLDFARGPLLKIAVALIGLRLSLGELGHLGWQALPLVLVAVLFGLVFTLGLMRVVGVHWRLAALLAVGTSICGASAIAATAPGLKANSTEVCYAVACIALIGLAATVIYPPLLAWLLDSPEQIGLVLGVAIHDTAQVTAAAALAEQAWAADGTLNAAVVAKLLRNSSMLVVIPALVWLVARHQGAGGRVPVPLFILAFIGLSLIRSLGDTWLGSDQAAWQAVIRSAGHFSLFAFAMAMAALAMAIRPAELRQLGLKPALAAVLAAAALLTLAVAWVV